MSMPLTFSLPLPETFRPEATLAFHGRDKQRISERVEPTALEKGMLWRGIPALLSVRFEAGRAAASLTLDDTIRTDDTLAFEAMLRRMLGLAQEVEAFEAIYREHPQLGRLIALRPGLRVPVATTPFEALSWAVTGQQISVSAAVSLRRKLIQATARSHSSGILCYPDATDILALSDENLRQAGFSATKAKTLRALSERVADGRLPLDAWAQVLPPVEEIREQLLAVHGIGPWTVNYALLRGFGWLDGSLHGDVAVRRGLQMLLASPDKIGELETQRWLAPFSPWRALIGAHLWAHSAVTA